MRREISSDENGSKHPVTIGDAVAALNAQVKAADETLQRAKETAHLADESLSMAQNTLSALDPPPIEDESGFTGD